MTGREIASVALFAAMIVALGAAPPIPLGLFPVPITLQTLGVMLAGVVLGARAGAMACLVVIGLVAIGLPVLSGGRGGVVVFAGPTAGFLLSWPLGAAVSGWAVRLLAPLSRPGLAAALASAVGGIGVIYAGGITWLVAVVGLAPRAAAFGSLAFLPGDVLKAGLAGMVAAQLDRAYPLARAWATTRSRAADRKVGGKP